MADPQILPSDIVIAVMGVTGVGKSTFINYFTDENVVIGKTLESCTEYVHSFKCSIPGVPKFFLVDTPGFDDSSRSDADVLRLLARELALAYNHGIKLSGIIYFHRIMDVRFGGASGRNLRMFKQLCGENNLDSVVLATTFWKNVPLDTGTERETQLRTDPKFWAPLVEKGSKIFRQDRENESGRDIIQHLLDRKTRVALTIQVELVDQKKTFAQTMAGTEVLAEMIEEKRKHEREIIELKKELDKAKAKAEQVVLQYEIREHNAMIERQDKAASKLRVKWDDAWENFSNRVWYHAHCHRCSPM